MQEIAKILNKRKKILKTEKPKKSPKTTHQILALEIAESFGKLKSKKDISVLMRICKNYNANYIRRIWELTKEKNPSKKMAYFLAIFRNQNEELKIKNSADKEHLAENKKTSIIFIGTSEFAVPILQSLIKKKYQIAAVITQPDKPAGRKQILTPPPIKNLAKKYKLKIFQPEKIKEMVEKIKKIKPAIIIVASYGQIIPKEILDIPVFGALNAHGSLLPKYRGASPIQTAILKGNKISGITIMKMDEKMDHGPIIKLARTKILSADTAGKLHDKLAFLAAKTLVKILPDYAGNKIKPRAQNHKQATFTKILKREDGKLNFTRTAPYIERQVRAYCPWPGTFCLANKKRLKIIKVQIHKKNGINKNSGEVFLSEDKKLIIKCKRGQLILEQVQPEGKNKMTGAEFWMGNKIKKLI